MHHSLNLACACSSDVPRDDASQAIRPREMWGIERERSKFRNICERLVSELRSPASQTVRAILGYTSLVTISRTPSETAFILRS
jgi:hypothetical protein